MPHAALWKSDLEKEHGAGQRPPADVFYDYLINVAIILEQLFRRNCSHFKKQLGLIVSRTIDNNCPRSKFTLGKAKPALIMAC